ncbi:MAG: D-glycerate dehydrogenase [Chloroflexi bacterium]|nr:D-glycerate dehydrogenase [Chloroflexota bacterium]
MDTVLGHVPPRVLVTRQIDPEGLATLRGAVDMRVWPGPCAPTPEELRRAAAPCHGLLTMLTDRVDEALLSACSELRIVSNMAVGLDNVDVDAATRRGVLVGHTPGVLTETTADFAFALLLATARRVVEADAFVRQGAWVAAGGWSPTMLVGAEVFGGTLGIIGLGRIGLAVARRARGFDMRVLYHSRHRSPEAEADLGLVYAPTLEELLSECDFVSLHVPLTPESRHLVGERALAQMKPTAILVNTSRGGVVDSGALAAALAEGRLAGAGLDVMETEPLSPDHPLASLPNVVLTPHIASASRATRRRMAEMAVENLRAGLAGELPPHCANPEAFRADP